MNTKIKIGALVAALCLFGIQSHAQTSVTTFGSSIVDTFTSYGGTAAPSGWTVSSGESFLGFGTGSGTSGGVVSFGADNTGVNTDRWFGFQFAASPSQLVTFTKSFVNNTGSVVTSLAISYDVFQFRLASGGRASTLAVNLDGGSSISALGFTATTTGTTGAVSPISGTTLSVTLTGLSISNGSSFSINILGDRGLTTGSAQGIGIDNFSVTAVSAVPEPSSTALLAGGLTLGAVLIQRRRKAVSAQV